MIRTLLTALLLGSLGTASAELPTRDAALEAWRTFNADPLARLDATQPFLDFISGSGEVHIVLNEALLGWMYDPIDPELKAVLYAAFLGANMASQLERGETGSDNVAAMNGALDAYAVIRKRRPEFILPLMDTLAAARSENRLSETVRNLTGGADAP